MNSKERHEARYQRRKAAREAKKLEYLEQYNDINTVVGIPALIKANKDSRQGVLWKPSVIRYNLNTNKNAVVSNNKVLNKKNICNGYYNFDIYERGKLRHIHSVHYTERVVRRACCINCFVPSLSHNLIYDNGASLVGKGINFHLDRCSYHLQRYYRTHRTNKGYILLIDFKGYFDNINHEKLFKNLDRYIVSSELNHLAKEFVRSAYRHSSDAKEGVGLFIGPEDSQIFSVSYINDIDHLIKDQWRVEGHARYMDDSYIIAETKEELQDMLVKLKIKYDEFGIKLNMKKTQICSLDGGFVWLKTFYRLTDTGKVVRIPVHDSIYRQRRKLRKFYKFYTAGEMTIEQVEQSYMSWRGYMQTKDAYWKIKRTDELFYNLFHTKPWITKAIRKKIKKKHGGIMYADR